MRRKLKKDASQPGPADLIIDGPLAFTGPSLCRGGKVSSSFINDETHVGYAEDIANVRSHHSAAAQHSAAVALSNN